MPADRHNLLTLAGCSSKFCGMRCFSSSSEINEKILVNTLVKRVSFCLLRNKANPAHKASLSNRKITKPNNYLTAYKNIRTGVGYRKVSSPRRVEFSRYQFFLCTFLDHFARRLSTELLSRPRNVLLLRVRRCSKAVIFYFKAQIKPVYSDLFQVKFKDLI